VSDQIKLTDGAMHNQALNRPDKELPKQSILDQPYIFSQVLDNIPDIIFYKDLDGVYLGCNREFARHVGRKKEEIVGKTDYDLYLAEEADFFRSHDLKVLEQNRPRRNEEWISYPDGRRILLDTLKTPYLGSDGNVIGVLGICRDITELKEAEEALKNNEQELKTITNNMTDIVAMADVEGNFTYISESNYRLLGYKPGDLLGKTIFELIHADDLAHVGTIYQEEIAEGHSNVRTEYRVRNIKGEYLWVETIGSLILDDNGQPTGALFTTRDISERKQAEFKIEEKNVILTALNKYTTKQTEIHTYENLIKMIAEQLTEQSGAIFVAFNEYDPSGKKLILRNIKSDQKFIDTAVRLGGKGITKIITPVSDEMYREITTDVVGSRHTLNEISQGMVPMAISRAIQKATGINYYVYLSHIVEDQLYGTSIIGLAKQENAPPFEFLESYAHISAISLRRLKAEEKIRYIGYHDQLTDLYNRYYFEACEKELKDIALLSVIMTDVNGLKLINDTYGHETGDKLLKTYADLLRRSFKQSDLIFRWGGDEFIVILKNTEEAKSWELCNRLIKYCGETLVKDIPLSISVGISSKLKGDDIGKAIREAEDMMYKNKLTESKSSKNLIMKTLRQTLAEKSFETREHINRMSQIGRSFGAKLSLPPSELSRLETLTMLHDIGKINIDSHILLKETALTEDDWEEIKKHPEVGYRITRTTEEFAYIADEILAHHERWDGKGYPRGLEGKSISYLARILSLIDSYDVMSNGRPYKPKMSDEQIICEIENCSGKQFDPELAEIFIACIKEGF
jgi:diguanylate cyclase (GGDEF)-like protein/PAS domain S-box-containing protein